jgi:hypothetical protein
MAQITPNMALVVWNNLSDPYNSAQLVDNFVKIDAHDHTGGTKGLQLDGALAIQANTITSAQLGTNSVSYDGLSKSTTDDNNRAVGTNTIKTGAVDTRSILDASVTSVKLAPGVAPVATVTSLPTTGLYEGYIVDYKYTATPTGYGSEQTFIWRLRYNGSTWDCIGGNPVQAMTSTTETTVTSTPDWDTSGFISIGVPLQGTYLVSYTGTARYASQGDDDAYRAGVGFGSAVWTGLSGSPSIVSKSGLYARNITYQYPSAQGSGSTLTWADSGTDNTTISGQIKATVGATNKNIGMAFQRTEGPTTLSVTSQIIQVMPVSDLI